MNYRPIINSKAAVSIYAGMQRIIGFTQLSALSSSQSTSKSHWLSCHGMLTKSNRIPLPQSYFARFSIDFPRPLCGNFGVAGRSVNATHTHMNIKILPIFMLYHNTYSEFVYVMNSFLARAMLSNYCVARFKINRQNHPITAQMRASRSSIVERGALEKSELSTGWMRDMERCRFDQHFHCQYTCLCWAQCFLPSFMCSRRRAIRGTGKIAA